MPNIASVLKAEITRLARKELREETDGLKKVIASQRAEINALKRRLQAIEKSVRHLDRAAAGQRKAATAKDREVVGADTEASHRFSAKGMATNRARLQLSAADFGLLVGASGQSVYGWESGKTRPKPEALAAIATLRQIGKREVQARLAQLRA